MLNKKLIGMILLVGLIVGGAKAATLEDLQSKVADLKKDVRTLIDQGKENSKRINELFTKVQEQLDKESPAQGTQSGQDGDDGSEMDRDEQS